ncbi:hypothetical protein D3C78_1315510 [compost metagenome]
MVAASPQRVAEMPRRDSGTRVCGSTVTTVGDVKAVIFTVSRSPMLDSLPPPYMITLRPIMPASKVADPTVRVSGLGYFQSVPPVSTAVPARLPS